MCQNISGKFLLAASQKFPLKIVFRKGTVIHPPFKKEGLRKIGYSMTMVLHTKKSRFESQQCLRLQNTTVLLQNATVITKSVDYITKCDSYYKMWRLLQNTPVQNLNLYHTFFRNLLAEVKISAIFMVR